MNYIFDQDGTIINSSEEVLSCFERAFEQANYQIDKKRLNSDVIGPPLKEIVQLIAPDLNDESIINDVISNFRQIYDYDENDKSFMYSGMVDLLSELKNNGNRLFIATLKPSIPTERLVRKFGLNEYFEDFYTIDKFGEHITKEDMISDIIGSYRLEPNETVMIGDAPSDIISAKNVGISGIGVLWGYGSDKEPLKLVSDFVVSNVGELRECLKSNYLTI